MEVRRHGNVLSTFREFADGTCEARLFYRQGDGSWSPPLPIGLVVPAERSHPGSGRATIERLGGATSFGLARTTERAPARRRVSRGKPYWQLREPERWRLRR